MAGGLFDKAIAAYEALFGMSEADDLRAQLDDERSESLMLVQRIADLKWELRTARATIDALEAEITSLRQRLDERNGNHGDTVRRQYSDVDAWKEAAGDMVQ
jgi:chromosome segregation ATPase